MVPIKGMTEGMRQRADGSQTYTTAAWDERYYWPVGTRVKVRGLDGLATISKTNGTTVRLRFDDGRAFTRLVPQAQLIRIASPVAADDTVTATCGATFLHWQLTEHLQQCATCAQAGAR